MGVLAVPVPLAVPVIVLVAAAIAIPAAAATPTSSDSQMRVPCGDMVKCWLLLLPAFTVPQSPMTDMATNCGKSEKTMHAACLWGAPVPAAAVALPAGAAMPLAV